MDVPLKLRRLAAVLAVEDRSPAYVETCAELLGDHAPTLLHLTRRARVASKELDRRATLPRLKRVR